MSVSTFSQKAENDTLSLSKQFEQVYMYTCSNCFDKDKVSFSAFCENVLTDINRQKINRYTNFIIDF